MGGQLYEEMYPIQARVVKTQEETWVAKEQEDKLEQTAAHNMRKRLVAESSLESSDDSSLACSEDLSSKSGSDDDGINDKEVDNEGVVEEEA